MDVLAFYIKVNTNISAGPSSILKVMLVSGAKVKKKSLVKCGYLIIIEA